MTICWGERSIYTGQKVSNWEERIRMIGHVMTCWHLSEGGYGGLGPWGPMFC